jgi:transcriptional regulator with GAF, ATPase, and Fis domain
MDVQTGDAAEDDATGELLSSEIGELVLQVGFDLALLARLDDKRLSLRAAFGPLAQGLPGDHAVPLAECPTESEALRTRAPVAISEAAAGVDPVSGLTLPAEHHRLTVPLLLGRRAIGVLCLVRKQPPAFDGAAIEAASAHARPLALALHAAAQSEEIERLKSHGDERISILETELRGPSDRVIEASSSAAMREVAWRARQVAPTETPVLILGETGTGKEWLAHAIHAWSTRAKKPFVKMNCAAIASGTLDSELFGHEKGAFTGATRARPGRFQIADGGTLLLDEIGELPLEVQAKLLRVLQDGTFFPVGSDRQVRVNVRILAATLVDLERAIAARTFRDDLFYRLNVFPLRVPPLRERLPDVPMLCEVLLAQQAARTGRRHVRVTPAGLAKLADYDWPGNLRELGNVLERATILSRSDELGPAVLDLPEHVAGALSPSGHPPPAADGDGDSNGDSNGKDALTLDDAQRVHIERALQTTNGKVYGDDGAAKLLGMKPSTLQSRMRKLGVRRPG